MDSKTIAWVSYLTFIGWIIAFVSHNNSVLKTSLATFHLRQSLGLIVLWIAVRVITLAIGIGFFGFFSFYGILNVLLLILWLLGFIPAVQGEEKPIPVVGSLFQQWFSFIK